jgi:hypothetical protein
MTNLSVKHSRFFSPVKLRYREHDRVPAPVKLRLGCKEESVNRNSPLEWKAYGRKDGGDGSQDLR